MIDDRTDGVINEKNRQKQIRKVLTDLRAAAAGVQVIIGEKLGLYKELAANGGLTAAELAELAGVSERYVRGWLKGQVASGHVDYNPETEVYSLTPEQETVLVNEDSPVYTAGGFCALEAIYDDEPTFAEVFQTLVYIHRGIAGKPRR